MKRKQSPEKKSEDIREWNQSDESQDAPGITLSYQDKLAQFHLLKNETENSNEFFDVTNGSQKMNRIYRAIFDSSAEQSKAHMPMECLYLPIVNSEGIILSNIYMKK